MMQSLLWKGAAYVTVQRCWVVGEPGGVDGGGGGHRWDALLKSLLIY